MPEMVVRTTFKGADKLSPMLKRMGVSVEVLGKKSTKAFGKATKGASMFRNVLGGMVVSNAINRLAGSATMALRGLTEEFIDFDTNITKAVTRLDGGLGRGSDAFKQFGQIARDEAKRTEFTAGEAAKGVEQLALAGFDVKKSMAALPGVLNLATNADVELATATRMATKTLGAFGLNVKSATQLQTNLTRVNDVFSKTVSSASINMEDLFEVMKFGGPAAKAAGQQLETFSAAAGVLANSAVDASIAGTSLRSMFVNLAAPTPKARGLIKKLGIGIKDSHGNFKDFFDIMGDVEKATGKMGNAQKLATLNILFGKRAVNAANILIEKGSKGLKDFRANLENAGGASQRMALIIRKSIGNRLKRLKSGLIEVGFKFIQAFNKDAGGSIDRAIDAVSKFDVQPVVDSLKSIIKFSKELFFAVKPFAQLLPTIIGMWFAYKAALKAIALFEAVRSFLMFASAVKAAAGAQGLLNLAMAANPALLLTAAIVGLTGAVIILATHTDDVWMGWEEGITRTVILFKGFALSVARLSQSIVKSMQPLLQILGVDKTITFGMDALVKDLETSLKASKIQLSDIQEVVGRASNVGGNVGLQSFSGLFGDGDTTGAARRRTEKAPVRPPNRSQVEAQQHLIRTTLEFINAPENLRVKTEKIFSEGRKLSVEGLGQNP